MNLADFARAVFALALTLGLLGLFAAGLRRYGPDLLARVSTQKAQRRLAIVETLVLDPSRRLVLVSCDGREQLLLLGEGRLLDAPPAQERA
jgi:flagellar protein FliO/FliZ